MRPLCIACIKRHVSINCSLQARSLSLSWKGTHVGRSAAVERGLSQGARSESTGPTWVSFQSPLFSSCWDGMMGAVPQNEGLNFYKE